MRLLLSLFLSALLLALVANPMRGEQPLDPVDPAKLPWVVEIDFGGESPGANSGIKLAWTGFPATGAVADKGELEWPDSTSVGLPAPASVIVFESEDWQFRPAGRVVDGGKYIVRYHAHRPASLHVEAETPTGQSIRQEVSLGQVHVRAWPVSGCAGRGDWTRGLSPYGQDQCKLILSAGRYAVRAVWLQAGTPWNDAPGGGAALWHRELDVAPGDQSLTISFPVKTEWKAVEITDKTGKCNPAEALLINCRWEIDSVANAMDLQLQANVGASEPERPGHEARVLAGRLHGMTNGGGELAQPLREGQVPHLPSVDFGEWYAVSPDRLAIYRARLDVGTMKMSFEEMPGAAKLSIRIKQPAEFRQMFSTLTVTTSAPPTAPPNYRGPEQPFNITIPQSGVLEFRSLPPGLVDVSVYRNPSAPAIHSATARRLEPGKTLVVSLPPDPSPDKGK